MNSKEENEFKNSLQDLVYDQTLECKKNIKEAIPDLIKNSENMKNNTNHIMYFRNLFSVLIYFISPILITLH